MDIKISVIIPVYNMGQYLKECLDSVVDQTLKEIEVIAVDDGSTDDSLSILKKYSDMYDNFVVFTQENQGAGPARNQGIRCAKGRYLIFIDPDDYYPSNDCLEALYNAAEEHDVLMCGGIVMRNNNGKKTIAGGEKRRGYYRNNIVSVCDYPEIYGHTGYIYRTDMIRSNNIFYGPYRRYQDQMFIVNAMAHAGVFYGLDKVVYEYRDGYKKLNFTLEISYDMLCGIRDVFRIVKEYNLVKMYEGKLKNIHMNYIIPFYKYSFCGNQKIDKVIEEINEIVKDWIGNEESIILTKEKVDGLRENCIKEYENVISILENERKKIIYGAGIKASKFIEHNVDKLENIMGVAVTSKQNGLVDTICGLPVRQIDDYLPYKKEALVMIATIPGYQEEIEQHLKDLGFAHVLKLDMKKIELAEELRSE